MNFNLKFLIFVIYTVTFAACSLNNIIENSLKPKHHDLVHGIQFLFDNFFFKFYKTGVIITAVQNPNDGDFKDFKNSLLTKPRHYDFNYVFCLENHTNVAITPRMARNTMVILIDTFESFQIFENKLNSTYFNVHGYYLFVLFKGAFEEQRMNNLTSSLWKRGIVYFYVIFKDSEFVNFTTIRPFNAKSCLNTSLVQVNQLKDGQFQRDTKSILFPIDKYLNLHNCTVNVVTFERCPAMCYERKKSFSGYDTEVIQAIRKRLNFHMNLTYLSGSEKWGTILPNGSTTDGLDFIRKGHADIGIGNYFLRLSRLRYFDATVSYYSIPIVLVIPPPKRKSPFEKLLQPFEKIIWILLVVVFSIGVLMILIINYKLKQLRNFVFGRNVKAPTMNMLVAIFGLQQTILPTRNFARFILMMFLMFCLVNRNVYQGALYIYLQSDGRHKEIQSIDEMVAKDFKFYIWASYIDLVNPESQIYKRKIIFRTDDELPFAREVDDTLLAALMTPLTNVMNRNEMARGKFVLRVCKEIVSVLSIVMYMPKGFFLKDTFNDLLLRFDCVGLLVHWFNTYAQKKFLNTDFGKSGPKRLNLDHLFGVFNVMLIGHGVAVAIFLFEHLYYQLMKLKTAKKELFKKKAVAPKKVVKVQVKPHAASKIRHKKV